MLIECQNRRARFLGRYNQWRVGSTTTLGKDTYVFKPLVDCPPEEARDHPHVCEVTNPNHIKVFLGIDAYRIYAPDGEVPEDEVPEDERQEADDGPAPGDDGFVPVTEILEDDEDDGPEVEGLEPSKMTNKSVLDFGLQQLGINTKSKVEIAKYALETCGVVIPIEGTSPSAMMRQLIEALQALPDDEADEAEAEAE